MAPKKGAAKSKTSPKKTGVVARRDEETSAVLSHLLVLGERGAHALGALRVVALADEGCVIAAEASR